MNTYARPSASPSRSTKHRPAPAVQPARWKRCLPHHRAVAHARPIPFHGRRWMAPRGWLREQGRCVGRQWRHDDHLVVSHIFRDSCHWKGTLRQTTSVAEVVEALTEQTGHRSTEPSATTFGGRPATRTEFSLPADADLSGCDEHYARLWPDAGPLGNTVSRSSRPDDNRLRRGTRWHRHPHGGHLEETSTAADVAELELVIESIRFQ